MLNKIKSRLVLLLRSLLRDLMQEEIAKNNTRKKRVWRAIDDVETFPL